MRQNDSRWHRFPARPGRLLVVTPLAAVAACGGGSGGTPSPTIKPGLDPCIVGTWKSTGVHGTVSSADGSIRIPLSGGAGEIAVIRPDGTISVNYAGAAPQQGTGSDGATYKINVTGTLTGRVRTASAQVTLDIANPSAATQTISQNGAVIQTVHPPPQEVSQYTCSAHSAFAVTTFGITTDWVPA